MTNETKSMFIVQAEKAGERTRFSVGCLSAQVDVVEALRRGGFRIERSYVGAPPLRSEEEQQRATRILGELFGH